MKLEEAYCTRHGCDPVRFREQMFNRGVPGRFLPLARLCRLFNARYFEPDLRFIVEAGEAQTVEQVRRAARDYLQMPENHRWLRRVVKLRVSATRIIRLAKDYLPER